MPTGGRREERGKELSPRLRVEVVLGARGYLDDSSLSDKLEPEWCGKCFQVRDQTQPLSESVFLTN